MRDCHDHLGGCLAAITLSCRCSFLQTTRFLSNHLHHCDHIDLDAEVVCSNDELANASHHGGRNVAIVAAFAGQVATLSVSRPINVVVLNCCVTETKETPCLSKISTIRLKSISERVRRSIFQTTTNVDAPFIDIAQKAPQGGAIYRPTGDTAIIVMSGRELPATARLGSNERFTGLTLGVE